MKNIILTIFALTVSVMLSARKGPENLTIVHFNDTHSHVDPERSASHFGHGGVLERAAYIDSVRMIDGHKNVMLMHAGDFSQGTSYFSKLNGDIEVDLINALEYDVVTLGNHEFDNGVEELARRLKSIKCPVVCANYDFSSAPISRFVKPYTIIRKSGLKIGVIGLLTDLTNVVEPGIAVNIQYFNPIETANVYASFLKDRRKCDLVIVLSHLGFTVDKDVAAMSKDIDVIVGGHSHTFLEHPEIVKNQDAEDVIVVTAECWGLFAGTLHVSGL